MIKNAHIGQRVWNAIFGLGVIIAICEETQEFKIYCDNRPTQHLPHTIKVDFSDDIWINTKYQDIEVLPQEDFPAPRIKSIRTSLLGF